MAVIVSSANPYMFRHQGAILREFNNNKESQVQHVLQLTNVPYKQTARFLLSTGHLSNSLISLVPPPSHRPLPDRPRHTGPFQTGPFYTGPFLLSFPFQRLSHLLQRMYSTCMSQ